jgi:hypothetical protein
MKTWTWPPRTSTHSAVLTTSLGAIAARFDLRRAAVVVASAPAAGSLPRGANGSIGGSVSTSAGSTSGSEPSGRRSPSGESPSTA